jgi:hypothetical protein
LINNVISTSGSSSGCSQTAGSGPGGSGGIIGGPPPVSTPEPGELALLSSGLLALAFFKVRKSRSGSFSS